MNAATSSQSQESLYAKLNPQHQQAVLNSPQFAQAIKDCIAENVKGDATAFLQSLRGAGHFDSKIQTLFRTPHGEPESMRYQENLHITPALAKVIRRRNEEGIDVYNSTEVVRVEDHRLWSRPAGAPPLDQDPNFRTLVINSDVQKLNQLVESVLPGIGAQIEKFEAERNRPYIPSGLLVDNDLAR